MDRIGKNIIFLYVRLIITMGLSLYTSRLLLTNLGVENFGVYNLVAGVVVMMAFLNNGMAASTQRFLSFEISNEAKFKSVFSNSKTLHHIIAVIVLVLGEIVGTVIINSYLNFGNADVLTINLIFQLSLATFIANIINVPYLSVIMAKQDMNFYALIGVLEGILKFFAAFFLAFFVNDQLVIYSIFIFVVTLISTLSCRLYVKRNYKFLTKDKLLHDPSIIREMSSFAGWNLVGVFAGIGYNNGVNLLLNIYFGVTVNAARAIVFQVQNAVLTVVNNMQVAFNPNIIKKYADNDTEGFTRLVFLSTKLSFIIITILVICLEVNLSEILLLWLVNVPENTDIYLKIVMIDVVLTTLINPLHTSIQASGKIKTYQIIVSSILLLNLPVSYLFIRAGYSPETTFVIAVCLNLITYGARIIILKQLMSFDVRNYLWKVVFPIVICLALLIISRIYLADINRLLLTMFLLLIFGICSLLLLFKKREITQIRNLIFKIHK